MTILQSLYQPGSPEARERSDRMWELLAELTQINESARTVASAEAQGLQKARGKLPVRERVAAVADPGSPLLEIAPIAGHDVPDHPGAGSGIMTAIVRVHGRPCMVVANDPATKGGTYFPLTIRKHLRAQDIALENHLACIYLVDSGGAFLPMQDEVFPDRFHFGRIFYNQARMSALGIPQISAVLGSCTAGGAYVPAMSDEVVMVRGNATIFLGGPPLVRAATGDEVSAEELGGAEVHSTVSGVSDHLADSEAAALGKVRDIIRAIGREDARIVPRLLPEQPPEDPRYDPRELYGIVDADLKRTFSAYEVLARLLDGSRLDEFKRTYARTIVCGFGHIYGYRIGVIANDGILFSESALKATHFIQLCNQRHTPILFLQNIAGFMVGTKYEHEGIAKHGAKMVSAVATCRVPKLTLIVGGSFGAGNYGMCGRAYEPRFLFSWPNSRTAVMGGAQAARVLTDVRRAGQARRNAVPDESALAAYHDEILAKYERESRATYGSARLWDDGILDPASTRETLAVALSAIEYDPALPYRPGVLRM